MSGPATGYRREMQLLICCARTRADAACAQRIRMLVSEDLDWHYLLAAATEHGVAPLMYRQLNAHCGDLVPSLWIERFRQAFLQNARHNLLLTAELFRILEACRASGIPAIPFKGPALAEQAFGNIAFRQFSDLDIIVRHRDITGVYALMNRLGYEPRLVSSPPLQDDQKVPGQYVFTSDAGQILSEIHTERTLRYFPIPLDVDALVGRLEPVPFGGRNLMCLSVEDALPLLCVHASKHFWERISWIADIAELAQVDRGVDWELTLTRASSLGAQRMLLLGLHLANDVLDAPLPESVLLRVLADRKVRLLGDFVRRELFYGAREAPGVARRALFRLRMRGSYWSGIAYVLRLAMAPTEEDWSQVQLKGPFSPLYAVLRPFRLLRKYGLGMFGSTRADRKPAPESSAEPTDRVTRYRF